MSTMNLRVDEKLAQGLNSIRAWFSEELAKRDKAHAEEIAGLERRMRELVIDTLVVIDAKHIPEGLFENVVDAPTPRKGNIADDYSSIRKAMPSNDFIGALLRDYEPPV